MIIQNRSKNEQTDVPKFTVTVIAHKQNDTFDTFIKETARNMIKNMRKYELNTNHNNAFASSQIPEPTDSIWAPWSKMFRQRKN